MIITARTVYEVQLAREEREVLWDAFKFFRDMDEQERRAVCCNVANSIDVGEEDFQKDFETMYNTLYAIIDSI